MLIVLDCEALAYNNMVAVPIDSIGAGFDAFT
jgi:hypothetical protein